MNIEQVCQTLNGGTPANAADLAALLTDRPAGACPGNPDRQYRRLAPVLECRIPTDAPTDPRHEDRCRDTLLDQALRQRLPEGVDAQREGQYANDKRADIRVSCRDFQVPVEVKEEQAPATCGARSATS